MNKKIFSDLLLKSFPYVPTQNQRVLISKLSAFLFLKNDNPAFVLKGYAGTGKTAIVGLLVNNLKRIGGKSVLLAPTGRAAKVLTYYSGKKASTIHKKLYIPSTQADGSIRLVLNQNKHRNTVFMVDEASMIPDNTLSSDFGLFVQRSLLDDLISYVFSGENCRLILIGDTAQLPPVGLEISPALDTQYLQQSYHLEIDSYEMTEVVRQSMDSGILINATELRKNLNKENDKGIHLSIENYKDVSRITGMDLEDALHTAYSNSGREETVIITRSNKRANIFNQEVRNRILFMDSELNAGDLLMVVKNNYYWLESDSKPGFIANGDIVEIQRIEKYINFYGFRFAEVVVKLIDYPEENDLKVKILLDVLSYEGPSLNSTDHQRLFEEVLKDYEDIPNRRTRIEKVKNNSYYNALQVKFAYALTCHKTQGGQWESVFIDQGYLTDDMINTEYYRWLYTAFTRATLKLYLVNFNNSFFE